MTETTTSHRGILFPDTLPAIPKGMRGFLIANPGTGKTLLLNWFAYLAASDGKSVLILDGETPRVQIESNLHRYSLHYGTDWRRLPITLQLSDNFEWGTINTERIGELNPDFVIIESIQSMSGNTNDPNVGALIKRTLNKVHNNTRWCLVSAHTNQNSFFLTRSQLEQLPTPDLARIVKGDTGIVSQGCDMAYILKQLSSEPLQLALIVKGRRGYFQSRTYYYKLNEPDGKSYDDPMWWEPIPPVNQDLTDNALRVLRFIRSQTTGDDTPDIVSAKEIMNTAVTIETEERRGIINLLVERGDILEAEGFNYTPRRRYRQGETRPDTDSVPEEVTEEVST